MAYVKIMFQDSPSTATPLNAANLNHMDDQIALNDQRLTELEGAHVSSFNGRTGAVAPESGDYNISQIAPLTGAQVGQVPVVVNVGTEEDPELKFAMGAGGGGGHVIQNALGTDMPQESAMQFADSFVSDDDVNGKTIVENIKEHTTKADYDNATEDGFHVIDDGNDVPIGEIEEDVVSVTADGVKTYKEILNEIYSNADISKINFNSHIRIANDVYAFDGFLRFSRARNNNNSFNNTSIIFDSVSSAVYAYSGTLPISDISNTQPPQGTIIALHYGTSSGIVELNTEVSYSTAERKIGRWIDGSDLYEKTVNCGALPNTTSKTVSHDIANISKIVEIKGYATNGTLYLPLPFAGSSVTTGVSVYVNTSNITFETGMDRSNFTESYVTLRYTKS